MAVAMAVPTALLSAVATAVATAVETAVETTVEMTVETSGVETAVATAFYRLRTITMVDYDFLYDCTIGCLYDSTDDAMGTSDQINIPKLLQNLDQRNRATIILEHRRDRAYAK